MSVPESPETPLQQLNLSKDSVSPCLNLKEAVIKADGVSACNNDSHNVHLEIEDRLKLKLPDDSNDSGIVKNDSNNSEINGGIDKPKSNCYQHGSKFLSSSDTDPENQAQTQGFTANHVPVTNFESNSRVMECNTSNDCGSIMSQISPLGEIDLVINCDGTGNSDISSKDSCNKSADVEQLIEDIESTSFLDRSTAEENDVVDGISYVVYKSEKQMPDIMRLITKDLSEPYSIYTYRYFIHNWPKLCFLAMDGDMCIGAIVCKLDLHKKMVRRGYIAMLAVDSAYRRRKLGSTLVTKAIKAMIRDDCDEVVLETEITNQAALRLYENLGFVRDKRLFRYYLNGVDALRLKLWLSQATLTSEVTN